MKKLSFLASEYLAMLEKKCQRRERSWATYEITERAFDYLMQFLKENDYGDMALSYFTEEHAEGFKGWLQDKSTLDSKTSVNTFLKTIRPPFRWAMDKRRRWIEEDVFKGLLLKPTKSKKRIFTPSEFSRMLQACPKENNLIWRCRLFCGYVLGMRTSEWMHLTIHDIDYEKNLVHIQPKEETRMTLAWEPKDKDCRTVPMPEEVAGEFAKRQDQLIEGQPYLLITAERYSHIMANRKTITQRIRRKLDENVAKPFKKICRRAQVPAGKPHDLRKSCLTLQAEAGLPPHMLAGMAGHSDEHTTNEYYIAVREKQMYQAIRQRQNHIIGATRLERATSRPPAVHSTKLSYAPFNQSQGAIAV